MSYEKLLEKIAQKERSIGMTSIEKAALSERMLEGREAERPEEEPEELVEKAEESQEKGEFKEALNELDAAKKAGASVEMIEDKMARLADIIIKADRMTPELLEVARAAAEYAKQLAEEHRK